MSKKIELQKVSLFENVFSTQQSKITINDYFQGIITGKWQDEVIEFRNKQDKELKKKITAVTASGLFRGRKDDDLEQHSGLLVIDIDEKDQERKIKEIRENLQEIPELFAVHYSLSGNSLAAYFRINRAKHFESYDAIAKLLVNDYAIIPDMSCSNIGRLRFVSYDPECHINYGASVWNYFEKKENKVNESTYNYHIYSDNDIDYILRQIKDGQINIAPDHYSWVRIGFALASQLGDGGRDAFKLISSFYFGKQKINPDKQFDNCLKSDRNRSGITIKSFFYYAKLAGCNLVSQETQKIKSIGRLRRKQENETGSGAIIDGKKDAKEFLENYEGITGKVVDRVLDQIWKLPAKELIPEEGVIFDIEMFLKSNYTFRMNEITNIVEVNGDPLNDYLFNTIQIRCKKIVEKANKETIFELLHSEFTPKYNPILEWFEKNKHIKTTGNIDKLAQCISSDINLTDAKFIRDFLEKWLVSIIASAHGIYSILCLVLTGQEQGTGKTNFFRELLPEELRWLFSINKLDGKESDVGMLMCSKWLILDDEFGGKSKSDEKKFKELISKDIFSIRKPYGRYFEDMRRLAVLCGTTNEEQVINDLTGNRRIIPIQVNSIDEKLFDSIDKTELFIELYWQFRENNKGWFLTKKDIDRLNEVCYNANQVSPEIELTQKYFSKCDINELGSKFITASEIRSAIEQRSGIRLSQQKLSVALKNIGYIKERRRFNDEQIRGFWVIDNNNKNENIQDNDMLQDVPF